MNAVGKVLAYFAVAVLLGSSTYLVYKEAAPFLVAPCSEPVYYAIGAYDARFGITKEELSATLAEAAAVWNEAAGKTVVALAPEGKEGIPVNMVYGTEQRTAELGAVIDAEQSAFDAQKATLEALKNEFETARASYERAAERYDDRAAEYHKDVSYWNAQGGAPATEYQKLQAEQKALAAEQKRLGEEADDLNALVKRLNQAVVELNALARKLNAKVGSYNEHAGEDFDQGNYVEDADGKRISIFEFESTAELARVMTHEFGHALSIGHVENPSSVMYSYNIGTSLILSEEDLAALREACRIE